MIEVQTNIQKVKVVIVEPIGELNLGSIARLCENFGVDELRLVSPRCNHLAPDAIRMAVHGKSFLENASIFSNLLDATNDCARVIATCGRIDHGNIPLHSCKKALKWLSEAKPNKPVAILFGREDKGLTNDELQIAQKVINIPTSIKYPSLNLSHAVAIILHQLNNYRELNDNRKLNLSHDPASSKEIDDCLEDAKDLLLEIGFLYSHTAKARMGKIKGLIQRAESRSEDISLIRGIIRQVRWFSNKRINKK